MVALSDILWWRDIRDPTFEINICRGIDGYGFSCGGTDSSRFANGPSLYQLLTCIYLITTEIDILNLYLTYTSILVLSFLYIMGFHIILLIIYRILNWFGDADHSFKFEKYHSCKFDTPYVYVRHIYVF